MIPTEDAARLSYGTSRADASFISFRNHGTLIQFSGSGRTGAGFQIKPFYCGGLCDFHSRDVKELRE